MNRTLRIAAPLGLAVVVAGALLGVFLTGDDPAPPAPADQVATAPETMTGAEESVSPADEVTEAVSDAETTETTLEERIEGSQTREIVEQAQQARETAGDTETEITVEELAAASDAADDVKGAADDPSTMVEDAEDAVRTERPDVVEPDTVLSEATPGDDQPLPAAEDPVDDVTARADQEAAPAAAEEEVAPPSFDVVRINPRGDAVIAGRAEPGAEVTIRDGDVDIGTVTADERGEWVLLPDAPLEGGDRELSIVETLPEGGQIESESVVVLSVPERDNGAAGDEAALAVLVPRDGEGASRVLQRPPEAAESFGVDRADHMTDDQLIASGRAAPGGLVEIFVDGATVGTARADDDGRWTFTATLPLGSGDHTLKAQALDEAGQSLAVVEMPLQTGIEAGTEVVTVPDEGIRDTEDGSLAIESVDYDEEGDVVIAGTAEPGAAVNVYVDDEHVGTIETTEEGAWELDPGDGIEPGEHRLRVDEIDQAGVVLARIETPLVRAQPEELTFGDAVVVVQPGNSLWRIARRTLGGGVHFTVIYEANRNQIRDPKLIYPGQIFTVPRLN